MKITVCIGSSCHLKGSHQIVEQLKAFITENHLEEQVELNGTFCMGNCQRGVSVSVNDQYYSVTPDTVEEFFNHTIKGQV